VISLRGAKPPFNRLEQGNPFFRLFHHPLTTRRIGVRYRDHMEMAMKKLLVILVPCMLATGCAPALYAAGAMSRRPNAHARVINTAPLTFPVGRWDNVMMLDAGTPLKVLKMDGTVVTGRFIVASNTTLRLAADDLEGGIPFADVMRVDRLGTASGTIAREGAKGAAVGAGAAGVLGLLFGVAPPPRVFAGAAILGAYHGAESAAGTPGPGTVYLAPSVVPGVPR
jgi:hypothetical protein